MEKDFSQEILDKIKKEQIKPKSRWHFILKDSVVWIVFGLSIVLGALAFSIILHFWEINDWDAYYRINENFLAFIALTMPYFWLVCFLLFLGVAFYYLKNTKTGYRFEFAKIVTWNVGLSLILGSVLYSVGVGRQVEGEFAKRSPFYEDIRNKQEGVWQRPEQGVIVGKIIMIAENGEMFELDDPRHIIWTVDASNAEYFQGFMIEEGYMVKVFGNSQGNNFFVAEEIRPLVKERGPRIQIIIPSSGQ